MGKKSLLVLVVVLAVAGVALYFLQSGGGLAIGGADFGGSERAWLKKATIDFLEDLQFKDFDKASSYHLEEAQKKRDIPKLIQNRFGIKHEVLDIVKYRVIDVDLDRSKERARVRTIIDYHVLGDRNVRDAEDASRDLEMIFYWFRKPDGTWYMELESSL